MTPDQFMSMVRLKKDHNGVSILYETDGVPEMSLAFWRHEVLCLCIKERIEGKFSPPDHLDEWTFVGRNVK